MAKLDISFQIIKISQSCQNKPFKKDVMQNLLLANALLNDKKG